MKQVYLRELLKDPNIIWMDVIHNYTKKEWTKKLKACMASNSDYCWELLGKYIDWLKRNEGTKIYIKKENK